MKPGDIVTDFCAHCETNRRVVITDVDARDYYVTYVCTKCGMESSHPFSEDSGIDEAILDTE